MILEHAPFGRRGFFSSFTLQGVQAGQIFAAAVFIPLARFMPRDDFMAWGWRIPFLLSVLVIVAGYVIRRGVDETPAFAEEEKQGGVPRAPIPEAFRLGWADMLRVVCMALMNVIPTVTTVFGAAYAVQKAYGIGFAPDVYLWIPVVGNIVAVLVIPFVGNLADRIGRRPPIIVGALVSGLLSFGYLYAISIGSVPLAVVMSVLMWGIVYQGYNAVFPVLLSGAVPDPGARDGDGDRAEHRTTITALLPALFAIVAPPVTRSVAAVGAWAGVEPQPVRLLAAAAVVRVMVEDDLQADLTGVVDDPLEDFPIRQTDQIAVRRVVDGAAAGRVERLHVEIGIGPGDADRVEPGADDAVADRAIADRPQSLQRIARRAIGAVPADRRNADHVALLIDDPTALRAQPSGRQQTAAPARRPQSGGARDCGSGRIGSSVHASLGRGGRGRTSVAEQAGGVHVMGDAGTSQAGEHHAQQRGQDIRSTGPPVGRDGCTNTRDLGPRLGRTALRQRVWRL